MYVVFSTPVCSKCKQLKNTLTTKSIPFREVNLWEDEESSRFLRSQSLLSLPQVFQEVGDELVYVGTTVEV